MVRVQLERLVQILFAVADVGRVVVAPALVVEQQWNHGSMRRCGRQADDARALFAAGPFELLLFLEIGDLGDPGVSRRSQAACRYFEQQFPAFRP